MKYVEQDMSPGYTKATTAKLEDLCMGHLTHKELANTLRMLGRYDANHEAMVTAARDRIAYLAAKVEQLEEEANARHGQKCPHCSTA